MPTPNQLRDAKARISPSEYSKIHYWLRKKYGKPTTCSSKKCSGIGKRIEWALIKGKKYEMKRSNFKALCKSCHSKYDMTQESKDKIGRHFRGKKMTSFQLRNRYKRVLQLRLNGEPVNTFASIEDASRLTGICSTAICHQLKRRSAYTRDINNEFIKYKWIYAK